MEININQELETQNLIEGVEINEIEESLNHSEIWWSLEHHKRSIFSKIKQNIMKFFKNNSIDQMKLSNQILFEGHQSYGRPWFLGLSQFKYLKTLGLKPHHKILDFGCGSGRLGIHLIKYLSNSCYFGLDSHLPSLVAFSYYELLINNLYHKKPRLANNRNFEFGVFDQKFDWIIDFFVSKHLNDKKLTSISKEIDLNLGENGIYLLSPYIPEMEKKLKNIGFETLKIEIQKVKYHLKEIENEWIVMRKKNNAEK